MKKPRLQLILQLKLSIYFFHDFAMAKKGACGGSTRGCFPRRIFSILWSGSLFGVGWSKPNFWKNFSSFFSVVVLALYFGIVDELQWPRGQSLLFGKMFKSRPVFFDRRCFSFSLRFQLFICLFRAAFPSTLVMTASSSCCRSHSRCCRTPSNS